MISEKELGMRYFIIGPYGPSLSANLNTLIVFTTSQSSRIFSLSLINSLIYYLQATVPQISKQKRGIEMKGDHTGSAELNASEKRQEILAFLG